jgi:hypothetical protein
MPQRQIPVPRPALWKHRERICTRKREVSEDVLALKSNVASLLADWELDRLLEKWPVPSLDEE